MRIASVSVIVIAWAFFVANGHDCSCEIEGRVLPRCGYECE